MSFITAGRQFIWFSGGTRWWHGRALHFWDRVDTGHDQWRSWATAGLRQQSSATSRGLELSWRTESLQWTRHVHTGPLRLQCRYAETCTDECFAVRVLKDVSQNNCEITLSAIKKVAHTRLPSVGFRSWSRFLAVSLQVTWVINPAVGCDYFPPGPQLPPQPLRGLLPISQLGEQRHDGCEQFA